MDDTALAEALKTASSPYDLEGLDALIGALEAGAARDGKAWHRLVVRDPTHEIARLLDERRAALSRPPQKPQADAARLTALRAALAEQDCAGMVLPRTDRHRSEYLPADMQRVAWLTGFTGSAGTVVVLPEEAALFVDGRYVAQAPKEVDTSVWTVVPVEEKEPLVWFEARLRQGMRIGYDPELHSASERDRLEKACAGAKTAAVALAPNPVDGLWAERPPAPVSPLTVLDVRYAGEEASAKRARMGRAVGEKGAKAALLTACDSIAWLLNLRAADVPYNPLFMSFALLHADGRVDLFTDPRRRPFGLELGNEVVIHPLDSLGEHLDELGRSGARVLADPATANAASIGRLRASGAELVEGADPCVLAKACKNATELAGAHAAQIRDGAALCRFLAWLDYEATPGEIDELALAARIDAERAKDPLFRGPSFETISASGPNAALPHYRATPEESRPLDDNALYLCDSGGQYPDGTTDVTRTVGIGRPGERFRLVYTTVLRGHIAVARAVFPRGTRGSQLDTLARMPLWRLGLDFDHGTGHGIGSYLCVHEGPQRIAKRGMDAVLQPGMIVSNEPGYYRTGAFGVRIENLVAVVEGPAPEGGDRPLLAFETLTRVPLDRRLIDQHLLDDEELAWIDRYHAKVRKDVMPLVESDEDVATWLAAATTPLRQDVL